MAQSDASVAKPLGEYHGLPILKTTIAITNAGDGLSKSMKIAPVIHEVDTEVMVLVRCTVSRHGYQLLDEDTPAYELKQSFKADTATVVTGAQYEKILNRQADAVRKAEAESKGQGRIPGTDERDLDGGDGDVPDPDDGDGDGD